MTVKDVATIGVETAGSDTTVEVLAATMADKDVGSIVIESDGTPVGIVTDRDLVVRVYAEGLDPTAVTAGDVMTTYPTTVGEDADVLVASALMRRHEVRRLPVVDEAGTLVGIVTLDDIARLLAVEFGNLVGVIEAESGAATARSGLR